MIQSWECSQVCWEGCWSLETPTALMLSAMSSCPDLPTALLAYKRKCTQRLRPRLGEGQLTLKALLQRPVSAGEIPAGAVPKYHTKISGAQQSTSSMDTEHKLDVTMLSLLWIVLGNLGRHSPACYFSLQLFLLLAWEALCQPLLFLPSKATAENITKNAALPKEQMGCLIHSEGMQSPYPSQQRETFHEMPSLKVLTKAGHVQSHTRRRDGHWYLSPAPRPHTMITWQHLTFHHAEGGIVAVALSGGVGCHAVVNPSIALLHVHDLENTIGKSYKPE